MEENFFSNASCYHCLCGKRDRSTSDHTCSTCGEGISWFCVEHKMSVKNKSHHDKKYHSTAATTTTTTTTQVVNNNKKRSKPEPTIATIPRLPVSEFWDMEADHFWRTLSTKNDVTTFSNFYLNFCEAIQVQTTDAAQKLIEMILFGKIGDAPLVSREDFETLLKKFGPFGKLPTKLEIFCGFDCGFYYGRCSKDDSKRYLTTALPQSWLIRESNSQGVGWFSLDRVTNDGRTKNIHTIRNTLAGLTVTVSERGAEADYKFGGLKQMVEFFDGKIIQLQNPHIYDSDLQGMSISSNYKQPPVPPKTQATYTNSISIELPFDTDFMK